MVSEKPNASFSLADLQNDGGARTNHTALARKKGAPVSGRAPQATKSALHSFRMRSFAVAPLRCDDGLPVRDDFNDLDMNFGPHSELQVVFLNSHTGIRPTMDQFAKYTELDLASRINRYFTPVRHCSVKHPDGFPPTWMHVSDGESTDGDP